MNENSTHTESLIQYLDGELQGDSLASVQKSIEENPIVHEELISLSMAKESVKSFGLKTRISSIHTEMMQELNKKNQSKTGIVRTIYQYTLRVAAVLIILFGLSALYQYYTATPEKLFNENFHAYELHETRGSSITSLEDLYEKGDMNGLIQQFDQLKSPHAKDFILAGNAFLSTHRPAKAIEAFTSLAQLNKMNNTHYFEEDAEYFLALSYLSNNEPARALPILEKIHADPNHPFHAAVSAWFVRKVKRLIG
jgi:hypothetical protein